MDLNAKLRTRHVHGPGADLVNVSVLSGAQHSGARILSPQNVAVMNNRLEHIHPLAELEVCPAPQSLERTTWEEVPASAEYFLTRWSVSSSVFSCDVAFCTGHTGSQRGAGCLRRLSAPAVSAPRALARMGWEAAGVTGVGDAGETCGESPGVTAWGTEGVMTWEWSRGQRGLRTRVQFCCIAASTSAAVTCAFCPGSASSPAGSPVAPSAWVPVCFCRKCVSMS